MGFLVPQNLVLFGYDQINQSSLKMLIASPGSYLRQMFAVSLAIPLHAFLPLVAGEKNGIWHLWTYLLNPAHEITDSRVMRSLVLVPCDHPILRHGITFLGLLGRVI